MKHGDIALRDKEDGTFHCILSASPVRERTKGREENHMAEVHVDGVKRMEMQGMQQARRPTRT
jgi:hypothetical protein